MECIKIRHSLFGECEVDSIRESTSDEEFIEALHISLTLHEPIERMDILGSDLLTFSLHERLES